jgi:hypothetical protein
MNKKPAFSVLYVTVTAYLASIANLQLSQSIPQENQKVPNTNTGDHPLRYCKIIFMVLPLMSEDIIHNIPFTYAAVTLHVGGHTSATLYNSIDDSWHRTNFNTLSSFIFSFWVNISEMYWPQVMWAEDILSKGEVSGLYCVQL